MLIARLLEDSKYAGKLPPITLSILSGPFDRTLANAVAESWKQVLGVSVTVQPQTPAAFLRGNLQALYFGWSADYADPESSVESNFASTSTGNITRYKNAEVDRLLAQARVDPDRARRFAAYNQVEQLVLDDAPWIVLASVNAAILVQPWVKDYVPPPFPLPFLRFARIER